jgi:hypothetical protein
MNQKLKDLGVISQQLIYLNSDYGRWANEKTLLKYELDCAKYIKQSDDMTMRDLLKIIFNSAKTDSEIAIPRVYKIGREFINCCPAELPASIYKAIKKLTKNRLIVELHDEIYHLHDLFWWMPYKDRIKLMSNLQYAVYYGGILSSLEHHINPRILNNCMLIIDPIAFGAILPEANRHINMSLQIHCKLIQITCQMIHDLYAKNLIERSNF